MLLYNAIKELNALPLDVNEINSKQKFDKALKTFFSTNPSDTI